MTFKLDSTVLHSLARDIHIALEQSSADAC